GRTGLDDDLLDALGPTGGRRPGELGGGRREEALRRGAQRQRLGELGDRDVGGRAVADDRRRRPRGVEAVGVHLGERGDQRLDVRRRVGGVARDRTEVGQRLGRGATG